MSRDPNDVNYDPTLPPEPWGDAIDAGRFLGDVVRLRARERSSGNRYAGLVVVA